MATLTPFLVGHYKIIGTVNNFISSCFVEEPSRAANKLSLTANQSHIEPLKYQNKTRKAILVISFLSMILAPPGQHHRKVR